MVHWLNTKMFVCDIALVRCYCTKKSGVVGEEARKSLVKSTISPSSYLEWGAPAAQLMNLYVAAALVVMAQDLGVGTLRGQDGKLPQVPAEVQNLGKHPLGSACKM